jgi:uncharacterized protein YjbI with pentapeptide repeats
VLLIYELHNTNLIDSNINEAEFVGVDLTTTIMTEFEITGEILHIGLSHKWVTWAGSY